MTDAICLILGILLLGFLMYLAFITAPGSSQEERGRLDAIKAYNLTGAIPKCPSVESLLNKRGATIEGIKAYIRGFNKGLKEIQKEEEENNGSSI